MIGVDRPVAWALTALFAVAAFCYLVTAASYLPVGPGRRRDVEVAVANVLVSGVMLLSLWGRGAHLSTIGQVTLFTAAAAWFVASLLVFDPPPIKGGTVRRWRMETSYQAALMGAMVWRAVALATTSTPAAVLAAKTIPQGAAASSGNSTAATAISTPATQAPGLSMPGMSMSTTQAPGTSTPTAPTPVRTGSGSSAKSASSSMDWVNVVSLLACIAFFAAAAWFLVAAVRGSKGARSADDAARGGRNVLAALLAVGVASVFAELA